MKLKIELIIYLILIFIISSASNAMNSKKSPFDENQGKKEYFIEFTRLDGSVYLKTGYNRWVEVIPTKDDFKKITKPHKEIVEFEFTNLNNKVYRSYDLVNWKLADNENKDLVKNYDYSLNLFPNPANQNINVEFNLPSAQYIKISVLTVYGQKFTSLFEGNTFPGLHSLTINQGVLPPGEYLVTMITLNGVVSKRLTVYK